MPAIFWLAFLIEIGAKYYILVVMKYAYKIVYDIDKDISNWHDALNSPFEGFGFSWIDNVTDADDRKIAEKIVGLSKTQAKKILSPYLLSQKDDPNSRLSKYMDTIRRDFDEKYVDACKALERITKRPMMSDKFTFCVTTFPRMQYFYKERLITMYDSTKGVWGMPIDGFLHEALHFQFIYYWREDKLSPVSKLNEDDFHYLKEALTIVLDDDLKPIITVSDKGYESQAAFCKILHEHWVKYHDFDELIEYGIDKLPDYIRN